MKKLLIILVGLILLSISGCGSYYTNRPVDWGRVQMYREIGGSIGRSVGGRSSLGGYYQNPYKFRQNHFNAYGY